MDQDLAHKTWWGMYIVYNWSIMGIYSTVRDLGLKMRDGHGHVHKRGNLIIPQVHTATK